MFHFGLLWNIFHTSVHDIGFGQSVQVADAATDQALEHEYVPIDRMGGPQTAQVGIVNPVPLFEGQIKRVAVHRLGYLVLVKRIVSCQPALDAPLDNRPYPVKIACNAVLGADLLVFLLFHILIEQWILSGKIMFLL